MAKKLLYYPPINILSNRLHQRTPYKTSVKGVESNEVKIQYAVFLNILIKSSNGHNALKWLVFEILASKIANIAARTNNIFEGIVCYKNLTLAHDQ